MPVTRIRHTAIPTLFAAAILSGCATQDALNEETAPIKSDLAKLEQSLRTSSESAELARKELAAARERERVLGARVDGLAAETKALRDQLAAQARASETAGADLRQGLTQTDRNLVDLAGLARDMGERLVAQDAALRAAATDVAGAAERASRSEQGLEALAARVGERLATQDGALRANAAEVAAASERMVRAEQGLETLAARLSETGKHVQALRGDVDQGLAAVGGLSGRVAGVETRMDKLADTLPQRVTQLELRLDELAQQVQGAVEMAAQHDIRRNGKVAFSIVLTEDRTMYPINLQFLGPRDRAQLDDLVKRVKEMGKDYHLEIQGHTDNTSVDDYNYLLGKARAEVVKRYLHEHGGIPLGWMSVISYGATQPLDSRSMGNRRIVIQTLVLDQDK